MKTKRRIRLTPGGVMLLAILIGLAITFLILGNGPSRALVGLLAVFIVALLLADLVEPPRRRP